MFVDRKMATPSGNRDMVELKNEVAGLHSGFRMLADTVKNKQEHFWSISESGFSHLVRNGQAWTSYVNKKHRHI